MTYPAAPVPDLPFVALATAGAPAARVPDLLLVMAAQGFGVLHVRMAGTVTVGGTAGQWRADPAGARAAVRAAWPALWATLGVPEGRAFACTLPAAWIGPGGVDASMSDFAWECLWQAVGPPDLMLLNDAESLLPGRTFQVRAVAGQPSGPKLHRWTCLTRRLGDAAVSQGAAPRRHWPSAHPWSARGLVVVDGAGSARMAEPLARAVPATQFAIASDAPLGPGCPSNLHAVPSADFDAVATGAWAVVVAPGDRAPHPGRWPAGTVVLGGGAPGAWSCKSLDEYVRAVAWARVAYAHRGGAGPARPPEALRRVVGELLASSCGGRGCDPPGGQRTPATATPTNRK